MEPPICVLCGRDALSGGLVSFRDAESLPDGVIGHPDGVCWFCKRHAADADANRHLDTADALRLLRRELRWRPRLGAVFDRIWRR